MRHDYILNRPNQFLWWRMLVGKEVTIVGEFRADSCHLRWRLWDDFRKRSQRPSEKPSGSF